MAVTKEESKAGCVQVHSQLELCTWDVGREGAERDRAGILAGTVCAYPYEPWLYVRCGGACL